MQHFFIDRAGGEEGEAEDLEKDKSRKKKKKRREKSRTEGRGKKEAKEKKANRMNLVAFSRPNQGKKRSSALQRRNSRTNDPPHESF